MKTIFLFLLVLLFACEAPKLDIPDYTPQIAVDGYIEAGEPPVVYLTYSSAFISSYDSMDFVNSVKFNVSAYIITEEDDTIGFTRTTNSDHFPPFKYTTGVGDLVGEAGKTYRLLIRKSGDDDITASTTIPEQSPDFLGLEYIPNNQRYGKYMMTFIDQGFSEYFFVQNRELSEADYYPIKFPVVSDKYANASSFELEIASGGSPSNLWMQQEDLDSLLDSGGGVGASDTVDGFFINDTILFKVSAIDLTSYDVLSSLFLDVSFPDNPFKPASYMPVSNVSNGIGRWTGTNSIEFTSLISNP